VEDLAVLIHLLYRIIKYTVVFRTAIETCSVRYTELTLLSADCIYEHNKTFPYITVGL